MCFPSLPTLPKADNVNLYYQALGVSYFRDGQLWVQGQVALQGAAIPTTARKSGVCTELNPRRNEIIF